MEEKKLLNWALALALIVFILSTSALILYVDENVSNNSPSLWTNNSGVATFDGDISIFESIGFFAGSSWTENVVYDSSVEEGYYYFDGFNDYMELDSLGDDYNTIAFWVKTGNNITPSSAYEMVVSDADYTAYIGFGNIAGGGYESLTLVNPATKRDQFDNFYSYSDMWYHIAYVWDDVTNNYDLYVDGTLQSVTRIGGGSMFWSNLTLTLGKRDGADSGYFKGYIDEFAVYNVSLSSSAINALSSNGRNQGCITSEGILAHWNGDDNNANDCTGNYNGTFFDGAGVVPVSSEPVVDEYLLEAKNDGSYIQVKAKDFIGAFISADGSVGWTGSCTNASYKNGLVVGCLD